MAEQKHHTNPSNAPVDTSTLTTLMAALAIPNHTYDGTTPVEDWIDAFERHISTMPFLSDPQIIALLLKSLKGTAKTVVETLPTSATLRDYQHLLRSTFEARSPYDDYQKRLRTFHQEKGESIRVYNIRANHLFRKYKKQTGSILPPPQQLSTYLKGLRSTFRNRVYNLAPDTLIKAQELASNFERMDDSGDADSFGVVNTVSAAEQHNDATMQKIDDLCGLVGQLVTALAKSNAPAQQAPPGFPAQNNANPPQRYGYASPRQPFRSSYSDQTYQRHSDYRQPNSGRNYGRRNNDQWNSGWRNNQRRPYNRQNQRGSYNQQWRNGGRRQPPRCFNCGEVGHVERNCLAPRVSTNNTSGYNNQTPVANQQSGRPIPPCSSCGGRHRTDQCRKRQYANMVTCDVTEQMEQQIHQEWGQEDDQDHGYDDMSDVIASYSDDEESFTVNVVTEEQKRKATTLTLPDSLEDDTFTVNVVTADTPDSQDSEPEPQSMAQADIKELPTVQPVRPMQPTNSTILPANMDLSSTVVEDTLMHSVMNKTWQLTQWQIHNLRGIAVSAGANCQDQNDPRSDFRQAVKQVFYELHFPRPVVAVSAAKDHSDVTFSVTCGCLWLDCGLFPLGSLPPSL